jgi:hypothetical protein
MQRLCCSQTRKIKSRERRKGLFVQLQNFVSISQRPQHAEADSAADIASSANTNSALARALQIK